MKEEGEGQSILSLTLRSTSTRTLGQQYKLLNPVRVGKMKIQQLVAIMTLHGESKGVNPQRTQYLITHKVVKQVAIGKSEETSTPQTGNETEHGIPS